MGQRRHHVEEPPGLATTELPLERGADPSVRGCRGESAWEPDGYRWAPPLIDTAGRRNPETPVTDACLTGWVQPGEVVRLLQWPSYYTGDTHDWHHGRHSCARWR